MFQDKIAPMPTGADWRDHIVEEQWSRYTRADHATWDRLYDRQVALLGRTAVSPFLAGLKRLGLDEPGIPALDRLTRRLHHATGWRLVPVAGIVPDAAFFAMLRDRVFPIGNFIRDGGNLDYLEEPDCFHDIFGHVPVLAHGPMAELMEAMGVLGVAACAAGHAELVSRLYWHTVEFGLAREDGAVKIWGAGLASSFGEARFSLEADVPRPRFTVPDAAATPYRSDRFQPLYFVSDSLETSARDLVEVSVDRLAALGAGQAESYATAR
ncbi:phenylalanine 4-monooxygenase [Sphingomicrobium sp. XHP0239]|uniref:phenylalanine 4-monooxygenase n=1 Tax=Sphingomicrobium maritimum TaxID=3133972 RepID=UPI0031CC863A